ncbi:hypothetical protein CL614_03145 [archaeon]|nr:hypothetical protein [archaeon]
MIDIVLSIGLIIGIIGAIFIMLSWILETKRLKEDKREFVNPLLPELTGVGAILLVVYSYIKGDAVFLILNIFVAIMIGMTLSYALKRRRRK